MSENIDLTISASSSSFYSFFGLWSGNNITISSHPKPENYLHPSGSGGSTTWVKQAGGWQQASRVYKNGSWTRLGEGSGMAWEAVNFLLEHLGFWSIAHPDYVSYRYKGDNKYEYSMPTRAIVPHWSDTQVREILAYTYKVIGLYETAQQGVHPASPKPDSELEVEEW